MKDLTFETIERARDALKYAPGAYAEVYRDMFNAALSWMHEYTGNPEVYGNGQAIPAGRLYKQSAEGRAILDLAELVLRGTRDFPPPFKPDDQAWETPKGW